MERDIKRIIPVGLRRGRYPHRQGWRRSPARARGADSGFQAAQQGERENDLAEAGMLEVAPEIVCVLPDKGS